ncbi:MAG TPA: sigma-70 family RNA polymerase sigma factor [Gaiellaceae bacterium]|nr:sigma-70 family RNA polymerase sigma factor [Gaiellaceae bacterium]
MSSMQAKIRLRAVGASHAKSSTEVRADPWQNFEDLIRRHHSELRRFAHCMIGDSAGADDALQTAYLNAYRAHERFREVEGGSRLAWLYRIVYRSCLDELRRGRRLRTLNIEDVPEPINPGPEIDQAVILRARLRDALLGLPVDARTAVLLVDGQGFDYETAATLLEVPRGTIASRLSAGRAALRRVLDEPTTVRSENK